MNRLLKQDNDSKGGTRVQTIIGFGIHGDNVSNKNNEGNANLSESKMTAGAHTISEQSCSMMIPDACLKQAGKMTVTGVSDDLAKLRKLPSQMLMAHFM